MNFCNPAATSTPAPSPAPPLAPGFVNLEEFSYQNPSGTTSEDYGLSNAYYTDQTNRATQPTTPTAYQQPSDGGTPIHLPHMRGDATIRPNNGNSNQTAGNVLGSLQEITSFLRWMSIVSTIAAIVWEGFAFPFRLIGVLWIHPAQVVLGAYLGICCLLILGAELNNASLRDNFGFLYDPLSRGFVLLLMSTMCLGILQSWWESLLGLSFLVVGSGYVYAYVTYPEYRHWQDYNERRPTNWRVDTMYWTPNGRGDPETIERRGRIRTDWPRQLL